MNLPTKKIALKTITGEDVTVEYKAVLSAWDSEQIQKEILKGQTLSGKQTEPLASVIFDAENKRLETLIVSWSLKEEPTPENIKKILPVQEYNKLKKELDRLLEEEEKVKKKTEKNS